MPEGQRDDRILATAEVVLAACERVLAVPPHEPAPRRRGRRRRGIEATGFAGEGVAEAMDGTDEPRFAGVVADRLPQLRHQPGQARLGDEGVRPEPVLQRLLGDRPWPLFEQRLEQKEGLGRQVHRARVPLELPHVGVEHAISEADPHGRYPDKGRKPKIFRKTSRSLAPILSSVGGAGNRTGGSGTRNRQTEGGGQ